MANYRFTGEFYADAKPLGRALMCLAVNDEYNMDTVDAEIAVYEYWHIHHQEAVMIDSVVETIRRWLNKMEYFDFAKSCITDRNTLDDKRKREKYCRLCRMLQLIMCDTTNAIIAQLSTVSHLRPSEILDDETIQQIVDKRNIFF